VLSQNSGTHAILAFGAHSDRLFSNTAGGPRARRFQLGLSETLSNPDRPVWSKLLIFLWESMNGKRRPRGKA